MKRQTINRIMITIFSLIITSSSFAGAGEGSSALSFKPMAVIELPEVICYSNPEVVTLPEVVIVEKRFPTLSENQKGKLAGLTVALAEIPKIETEVLHEKGIKIASLDSRIDF